MPKENNTQLSWIKHRFREKGYTQEEFAKAIGCGYAHFSLSVNERAKFSITEMRKIARLLNIPQKDIGELFNVGIEDKEERKQPRRVFTFKSLARTAYK